MNPTTPIPQTPPDYDRTHVIERPDGFYWQDKLSDKVYGPFPTLLEAVQDMEEQEDTSGETLEEAEAEIGIAGWTDPDTGQPAEGVQPRLRDQ